MRSLAAIDRCDVALLLIDAQQGVTEQDSKIAGYIDEQGKAAVIIVNKSVNAYPEDRESVLFFYQLRQEISLYSILHHSSCVPFWHAA